VAPPWRSRPPAGAAASTTTSPNARRQRRADDEQPLERDAERRRRRRVELPPAVDVGGDGSPCRHAGEGAQRDLRLPAPGDAAQVDERPARKPTAEQRVDRRPARRHHGVAARRAALDALDPRAQLLDDLLVRHLTPPSDDTARTFR
jgi:hypothetical protein